MKTSFIALFAAGSAAHTIFQEMYIDGVSQGHLYGIRTVQSSNPLKNITSPDIICNGAVNNFTQNPAADVISLPAGSTITTEWHNKLLGLDPSNPDDPIAKSHLGPIQTYMAPIDDIYDTDVESLEWFKIYQDGVTFNNTWATQKMMAAAGKVTHTVPSCIPSGTYLLKAEIVALHAVGDTGKNVEIFTECAQVNITGGGDAELPKFRFQEGYTPTTPGLNFNVYASPPNLDYPFPGPELFTC
ncbi:putative glycosyl hydrolase family 61 protein 2 [Elsinoe fawcettii]|nr:putative glycosyl hydrolase family 61 protein 2 [Elsinoe fawcettii]